MEKQLETNAQASEQKEGYTFVCRWCGEQVEMSADEVRWYQNQGFAMPTRCIRCRRKRRGIIARNTRQESAEK